MVWVSRNIWIDGNEIADHLARQGSSLPLTETQTALGISIMVAREVTTSWMSRENKRQLQPIRQQRQAKGFLKGPSTKRARKLLNLSRNQSI